MIVGIIPDGNRRWARKNGIDVREGHRRGAKVMEKFLKYCSRRNDVSEVVIYALSEDNLVKRSKEELDNLFNIYKTYFNKLKNQKIKVRVLWTTDRLPKSFVDLCLKIMRETINFTKGCVTLLLGWSAQNEILKHFVKTKKLLYDKSIDLLIRTGNVFRISDFLSYQIAYAELVFEKKMFPECNEKDFERWFKEFYRRKRRFGA